MFFIKLLFVEKKSTNGLQPFDPIDIHTRENQMKEKQVFHPIWRKKILGLSLKKIKDSIIQFFYKKMVKMSLGTSWDSFERFDENPLKYSISNQAFKPSLMKEKE